MSYSGVLPLVGLTGHAGAGKDSVARILVAEYGYARRALADGLKLEVWLKSAASLVHYSADGHRLDWPTWLEYIERYKFDSPDSAHGWPRLLLQAWGQMRRDLCGEDYWLRKLALGPGVVVSDVRYPNEAAAIREADGLLWRIVRPGYDGDGHASEVLVDRLDVQCTIHNAGSLDELAVKVRRALDG